MQKDPSGITDDAMVVESQMGVTVRMVEGSYQNIKITTPEDLGIAESILKTRKYDRYLTEREQRAQTGR